MLNLQGDIIAIYDNTGTVVVEYLYDSWGKLESITGSLALTVGIKNPLRYRGYYYDTETSLYYLQSRYYDPETCRFISMDAYFVAGDDLIQGTNMYSYCLNNPVMYVDPTGKFGEYFSNLLTLFSNMFLTDRKGIDENNLEIFGMFRVATESLGYSFSGGQADFDVSVLSSGVVKVVFTITDTYLFENSTNKGSYVVGMYYGNHEQWINESVNYQNQKYLEGIVLIACDLLIGTLAPPMMYIVTPISIYLTLNPDSYQKFINDMLSYSNKADGYTFGIYKITRQSTKETIYEYPGRW